MPADMPADASADAMAAGRSPQSSDAPEAAAPSTPAPEAAGEELLTGAARIAAARRLQDALWPGLRNPVGSTSGGLVHDSDSEGRSQQLDELAAMAARLLGTTSARIALLSDVQLLVGAAGPQPAPGPEGAEPLTQWLCAQTAAADDLLAIPDAAADEDVAALAAVASGVIGAYLGTPLRSPSGQVVGALCVFGPQARAWSRQDTELLAHIATAAAAQLELAALGGERTADRTLLELTIAAAELGTFDLDLATGELVMDERLLALSELTPATFGGSPQDVYAHIHPEDREATIAAVAESTTHGGTYSSQYRIVAADGTHRWVAARGTTLPGPDGSPARLLGAAFDVSAVRQAATRAEQIMDAMAVAYLAMDVRGHDDWPITYVNDEGQRIAGASREELVGRSFWDAFPATVGTVFEQRYRDAVTTGRTVTFDAFYPAPLDVWVEVRAVPETTTSGQALGLYFLDITARKSAQAAAETAAARAHLLAAVTQELSGTLEVEEAVSHLAQRVVPALGDWCLISILDDEATATTLTSARASTAAGRSGDLRRGLRDVGVWHHDEQQRVLVEKYAAVRLSELSDDAFVWQALRQARPVLVPDATRALTDLLAPDGRGRELLAQLAPASGAIFPLRGRGRTVGLMSLFSGAQRSALSEQELSTAAEVADRAGLALDSARLYRQQRDLAEGLQRALLSEPPEPDHGQIVVRYRPAGEAAQIGGDWYDAFMQPGGATVLVIGDVVGHDIQAAAAMSQVRTVMRTIGALGEERPSQILTETDRALANLQVSTTATAIVARVEQIPAERQRGVTRLRWSNAGHPPAMVINPDGTVLPLAGASSDLLLGVLPGTRRRDAEVVLDRGSTVVLYTDGLVERRSDQSLAVGLDRLRDVLEELAQAGGPDGLDLDTLVDEMLTRMLPARVEDDAAVVALRLHRQDRPRPAEAGPRRVPPHVPDEPGPDA
ncbi:SpoIIE family protein phosphatase [Kineococcus endophyticus]|uniref:SpoIIE family protein phosphatase n=1 Tax=Kineococcus endophyticus TaxID=1181883 RepID=A0ABV3P4J8_9ACTN